MLVNRKVKIVTIVIAAAWVLLMVIFAPRFISLWKQRQLADQEFHQYAESLINGDYMNAYRHCGRKFRDAVPYEVFVSQQNLLASNHGRLKTIERGQFVIHGYGDTMTAIINARFIYEKGDVEFALRLEPSQGQWELYGYKQLE